MKSADYYDSLPYKMVVTPDVEGGGYVASFQTCRDVLPMRIPKKRQ